MLIHADQQQFVKPSDLQPVWHHVQSRLDAPPSSLSRSLCLGLGIKEEKNENNANVNGVVPIPVPERYFFDTRSFKSNLNNNKNTVHLQFSPVEIIFHCLILNCCMTVLCCYIFGTNVAFGFIYIHIKT